MIWESIVNFLKDVIAPLGGFVGLVILVVKFAFKYLSEKFSKDYDLKLNKELEAYRNEFAKELEEQKFAMDKLKEENKLLLSKKEYISKTRFDAEFAIYRELCSAFFPLVMAVENLIYIGTPYLNSKLSTSKFQLKKLQIKVLNRIQEAQKSYYSNAPFIIREIAGNFEAILNDCKVSYNNHLTIEGYSDVRERNAFEEKNNPYTKMHEILKKWKRLTEQIREYLASLDVLE